MNSQNMHSSPTPRSRQPEVNHLHGKEMKLSSLEEGDQGMDIRVRVLSKSPIQEGGMDMYYSPFFSCKLIDDDCSEMDAFFFKSKRVLSETTHGLEVDFHNFPAVYSQLDPNECYVITGGTCKVIRKRKVLHFWNDRVKIYVQKGECPNIPTGFVDKAVDFHMLKKIKPGSIVDFKGVVYDVKLEKSFQKVLELTSGRNKFMHVDLDIFLARLINRKYENGDGYYFSNLEVVEKKSKNTVVEPVVVVPGSGAPVVGTQTVEPAVVGPVVEPVIAPVAPVIRLKTTLDSDAYKIDSPNRPRFLKIKKVCGV